MGPGRRLELTFQVFNAFNSSGVTYLTGNAVRPGDLITSAPVARIGAGFIF